MLCLFLFLLMLSLISIQSFQLKNGNIGNSLMKTVFLKKDLVLNKKFIIKPFSTSDSNDIQVSSEEPVIITDKDKLAAWFSPNTRGGILVLCGLLTLVPLAVYKVLISSGLEETTVGAYVGAVFVLLSNVLWASTYIFRVANKDMTYAKQLRDYENAVLQKRLEELADDEINALLEEIELEEKQTSSTDSNINNTI